MSLKEGVEQMQKFLSYNNISFNQGRVVEYFNVSYFIGDSLKFTKNTQVLFDFIHTDFTRNIGLLDNDIDSNKYYTEFTPKYQTYTFNKEDNQFVIELNGSNKHGESYKIVISN